MSIKDSHRSALEYQDHISYTNSSRESDTKRFPCSIAHHKVICTYNQLSTHRFRRLSTMADFISRSMSIIEDVLPDQFGGGYQDTIINSRAEEISTSSDAKTKLYAVSLTGGSLRVNMRSPTLIRELKRLAQAGGGSRTVGDVRWQFITREFPSLFDRYAGQACHAHGNFGTVWETSMADDRLDSGGTGTTTPISHLSG